MEEKEFQGQKIFRYFLVLFLIFLFLLGKMLWPYIHTLIFAFIITGIFNPIYRFLKKKMRPGWASFLTCLLIFLIIFVPTILFIGSLTQEAMSLYQMGSKGIMAEKTKELLENSRFLIKIGELLDRYHIKLDSAQFNTALSNLGKEMGLYLLEQARSIASNMVTFVFNFFLMLLTIFFLFLDGHKLLNFMISISPLPIEQIKKLIDKFEEMAGAILVGNGLTGVIEGISGGLVFAVLGLRSPFFWGVVMAILAFIPFVGIAVVFFPASIYLFLTGRIAASVVLIIFYILITIFIEYILKARLVGEKSKMHILLVILSTIGGLKVFGISGIIYGPLVASAFLTLVEIYRTSYEDYVKGTK